MEKKFKNCGKTRFSFLDFLILHSELVWFFILWALWSSRNLKSAPPYFCVPKFNPFHLNSAAPNILSSRAQYFLWALRHFFVLWSSFYLKSVPPHVLLSGPHFISGALRQSFCAPVRWKGAPIWNFALLICCNSCLVATVFPILIENNRLRIDFQNMCDVCEEHLFSEKMKLWDDRRTKQKVKKQKHEGKFKKNCAATNEEDKTHKQRKTCNYKI